MHIKVLRHHRARDRLRRYQERYYNRQLDATLQTIGRIHPADQRGCRVVSKLLSEAAERYHNWSERSQIGRQIVELEAAMMVPTLSKSGSRHSTGTAPVTTLRRGAW